jgi:type I restriction enzyme, R subunit
VARAKRLFAARIELTVGTDVDAFRRKARVFLKPHENHIAVLKLKRNEPLTATDLKELERIFLEAGVDETALDALQSDGGLPLRDIEPRSAA